MYFLFLYSRSTYDMYDTTKKEAFTPTTTEKPKSKGSNWIGTPASGDVPKSWVHTNYDPRRYRIQYHKAVSQNSLKIFSHPRGVFSLTKIFYYTIL